MLRDRILKYTTMMSLFFFAVGVFTSTSALSVSSVAASLSILLFYTKKENLGEIRKLPKSSLALLSMAVIGLISFGVNYYEADQPFEMLNKLKYYVIAGLWLPVLKKHLVGISRLEKAIYIYGLIITVIIAAGYGYYINPNGRTSGLIGIIRFPYTLALLLPWAIYYSIKGMENVVSIWALRVFPVIILVTLITTGSRGAIIGFIVALVSIVFFIANRKIFISLCILVGIFSFFTAKVITSTDHPLLKNRFFQSMKSRSNLTRVSYYKSALYGIAERPLFGFGMQRFPSQIKRIKVKHDLEFKQYVAHSHNVFLEMGAQIGLLGLFTFLLWFFFWGVEMYRLGKMVLFVPFALVFFVIGQFDYIFYTNNMLLSFVIYHLSFIIPVVGKKEVS